MEKIRIKLARWTWTGPPASNDDPNAVKVGNFAIIPTIDKSDYKSVYESETSKPPSISGLFSIKKEKIIL